MFRPPSPRPDGIVAARRRRSVQPRLEDLEARLLLFATNGGEWVHPERVTFSFAPDGTDVGGLSSNLNASMAARGFALDAWRNAVRDAAAVWEQVAGINLAEVSDSGSPYSVAGNQQSDSRFGDIRIAGVDLGPGSLGLAFTPPPINGGTLAGDIVLNSAAYWSLTGDYSLETVAIHEFGHALGMDHATISAAEMYAYYTGVKTSLHSDDIAGIQAVYGTRPPDPLEGSGNQTYTTATNITASIDAGGKVRLGNLSLHTLPGGSSDQDWFTITVPSTTTGTMNVTMQSTNLSLLSPRFAVYNSSLQGVAIAQASYAYGATISVNVGVSPGQTYYIRALPANAGPTSAGAYGLLVNFTGGTQAPIDPPNTTVLEQPSRGGGSSGLSLGGGIGLGAGNGFGFGFGNGYGYGNLSGLGTGFPFGFAFGTPRGPLQTFGDGRLRLGSLLGAGDELTLPGASRPRRDDAPANPAPVLGLLPAEPATLPTPAPRNGPTPLGVAAHFRPRRT